MAEQLCARCEWCPFDERELPPPTKLGSGAVEAKVLTFDCEPTGRRQPVDGGRACRFFRART